MADLECDLHSGKLAEVGLKVVEFHLRRCPIVAAGTTLSVPHDPLHQGSHARLSRCFHLAGERLLNSAAVLEGSSCRESITIRAMAGRGGCVGSRQHSFSTYPILDNPC